MTAISFSTLRRLNIKAICELVPLILSDNEIGNPTLDKGPGEQDEV
jgi:hypothetical protein